MTSWREQIAQSEVDDLNVSCLADENILNLEVSVDNAVPVAVVKSTSNLTTKLSGLLLFQLSMGDDVVEHLPAIHILK